MSLAIRFTDDEQVAVEDGQAELDRLLNKLADIATPAGSTPRDIGVLATATLLPIVEVK